MATKPFSLASMGADLQGPFSEYLTEPARQAAPVQSTPSKAGGVAFYGTQILKGIQEGRTRKFLQQEQARQQKLGMFLGAFEDAIKDADTPEKRHALQMVRMQLLARGIQHELRSDEEGSGKTGKRGKAAMKDESLAGKIKGVLGSIAEKIAPLPPGSPVVDMDMAFKAITSIIKSPGKEEGTNEAIKQMQQGRDEAAKAAQNAGRSITPEDLQANKNYTEGLNKLSRYSPERVQAIAGTMLGGATTLEQQMQQEGIQWLRNLEKSQQTKPSAQPGESRTGPPSTDTAPLYGSPVNPPLSAQMVLHKSGFSPKVAYMISDSGSRPTIGVEEFAPGQYRKLGTNEVINPSGMLRSGYRITPEKPPRELWTKVGSVLGPDHKYHEKFVRFGEGNSVETYVDPSVVHVTGADAQLAALRRDSAFARLEDNVYNRYNREIDSISARAESERTRIELRTDITDPAKRQELFEKNQAEKDKLIADAETRRNTDLRRVYSRFGLKFETGESAAPDYSKPLSDEQIDKVIH